MVDETVTEVTVLPEEDTYMQIYFTLDSTGHVVTWGTSNDPARQEEQSLLVPNDHPITQYANCLLFKYDGEDLVYDEAQAMTFTKLATLSKIRDASEQEAIVVYDGITYSYTSDDQVNYQKILNNYLITGNNEETTLSGESDTGTVSKTLNKQEFCEFFAYCSAYEKYKETLVDSYYADLIEACESEDELEAVTWSSEPKKGYPLPDKTVVDLNGDGAVSKEEYEALLKENKELHQRVEFNEQALLDAINMLSSMIMP